MKSLTVADVANARAAIAGSKPRRSTRRPSLGETFAFRDTLLDQISSRIPRLPGELSRSMADEWGSHTQRQFYRAIAWLLSRGKIIRVGPRMACVDGGYVRTADGGAETAEDVDARRRIALADEGRCYGCARKIRAQKKYQERRCPACYRALARVRERISYRRRMARVRAVAA